MPKHTKVNKHYKPEQCFEHFSETQYENSKVTLCENCKNNHSSKYCVNKFCKNCCRSHECVKHGNYNKYVLMCKNSDFIINYDTFAIQNIYL